MISRTLICISFLILMSCTDHQRVRQTAGIIDIGLMDVQEEEPRYAVQTIIPLETTTDNLLGVNLIIKSLGENVFVLDEDRKDAIYRFDQTGDFLGKVVQVGEGPGMLNNITDFVADRDSLHVLDRNSTRLNSSHVKISYAVFCLKKKKYNTAIA